MGFYDIFSKLCKEREISPSAVARSIGLTTATPTYWKRGSIPKGDTLQKLADYFGVSVDYLLDLSVEDQKALQYIEDYVVQSTGIDREEIHKRLVNEKIAEIPYEIYNAAIESADNVLVDKFRAISDSQLKKYLLDDYQHLNRRGQIEIVIRIAELAEIPRYRKDFPQPSQAPPPPDSETTPEDD